MTTHGNQLAQAQRLELIGTVASGVAHDLNNQLTVILNHLDFALARLEPSHAVRANLQDVRRAADRCAEMLATLVGFGARTTTRYRSMDLEPVLSETTRLLRRVIPSNVEISLTVEPKLQPVVADATQIQQILVNLSINARDAMPAGGVIRIAARNELNTVIVTVSDTGCGVPEAARDRIFEPFFTTKGETGGSGLGLAMVAAIAEKHGGTITFASEPGQGTSFHLSLPAATQAETESLMHAEVPPSKPAAKGCILLADDNEMVRHVAKTALVLRGYRVIEACDGQEAVDLFRTHADEIDLLFLDMTMPRASGLEALARVRSINPDVKALLTSGYDIARETEFLPKPYTAAALLHHIERILRPVNRPPAPAI